MGCTGFIIFCMCHGVGWGLVLKVILPSWWYNKSRSCHWLLSINGFNRRGVPTTGLRKPSLHALFCVLERWVAEVWTKRKGSTGTQPSEGTIPWSLVHISISVWYLCRVVQRGRTRWPEVSRFQGNMTVAKQTHQCSLKALSASASCCLQNVCLTLLAQSASSKNS